MQESSKSCSKPDRTTLLTSAKCRCPLGLENSYFCWSCWNQNNSTVSSGTVCYAWRLLLLASGMESKCYCAGERSGVFSQPKLFQDSMTYVFSQIQSVYDHNLPPASCWMGVSAYSTLENCWQMQCILHDWCCLKEALSFLFICLIFPLLYPLPLHVF